MRPRDGAECGRRSVAPPRVEQPGRTPLPGGGGGRSCAHLGPLYVAWTPPAPIGPSPRCVPPSAGTHGVLRSQPLSVFQPPPQHAAPMHAPLTHAQPRACKPSHACTALLCMKTSSHARRSHALSATHTPHVCSPLHTNTPPQPFQNPIQTYGMPNSNAGTCHILAGCRPHALTALWVQWGWWQPPTVRQSHGGATLGVGCSPWLCCVPALCPLPAGRCAQRLLPRLPAVLHLSLRGCERGAEHNQS